MRTLQLLLLLFLSGGHFYCSGTDQSESQNQSKDQSFQVFWIEFRGAVMKNDTTKLINLTRFPLKTRGEMDEDPIILIHENSFVSFFKQFMLIKNRFPHEITDHKDRIRITHYDYISNLENPEKAGILQGTKSWQRVGDLVFEKINNEWKLTFIYFPYRAVESDC